MNKLGDLCAGVLVIQETEPWNARTIVFAEVMDQLARSASAA
jgi:hypothetical protein